MQIAMMVAAQRHSELITDLATERTWLRKFEMKRIARRASAHETRL
jgi:hypothetical protein